MYESICTDKIIKNNLDRLVDMHKLPFVRTVFS